MRFDSARADRIAAVVLFALGIAMLYGGYVMDRLEIRDIHPASIPGLVPMILGATLALCAVLLFAGARVDPERGTAGPGGTSWSNFSVALGLCLVYAVLLVGNLPFFWATALFIAVFAGHYLWRDGEGPFRWRTVLVAAGFGVVVSGAVSVLFRYGFLVRLP